MVSNYPKKEKWKNAHILLELSRKKQLIHTKINVFMLYEPVLQE